MTYGTFRISREELVEQLSSRSIFLSSSLPIFYDDKLDQPLGYTDDKFDGEGGIICYVEESIFDEIWRDGIEYRFGYKLNIDSSGARQIELTSINIVPKQISV